MSVVFVPDVKGRWINLAHVVIIVDRDNTALLTNGTSVQLREDWHADCNAVVVGKDQAS